MATVLDNKYKEYFSAFEENAIKESSAYDRMLKSLEESFEEFGLDAEKRAELLIQAHITALNSIQGNANSAVLAIIAEEKKQELIEAQISKEIAAKALLNEQRNTQIEATAKMRSDKYKVDKEIAHLNEMILTQAEATGKMREDKINASKQGLKIGYEMKKIDRDIKGYADQMHIKACEYKSSLASFAVNAGGDEAQMQAAIDKFNNQVTTMLRRATP